METKMTTDREFKGSKYDANMDVAAVAKAIRADIKEAIKAKHLPAGSYSVTIKRYSGGQSINVAISGVQFVVLNRARVIADATAPHTFNGLPIHSDAGAEILKRAESMLQAYNRDSSDIQTDYFNVKFYGHVRFDWEFEKAQRDAMLEQIKTGVA